MIRQGDVISYLEMIKEEGITLQKGMNFKLRGQLSVILMSLRPDAPYRDRIDDQGRTLIYEGHDISSTRSGPDAKIVDQPMYNPGGGLTQNGLFYVAAKRHNEEGAEPELVKVYEKIRSGIWVFNGIFKLVDAYQELSGGRKVFKFRLELIEDTVVISGSQLGDLDHNRLIPTSVKLKVWKRDKGRCVNCGSQDNLHFDHIIPYSKGGSSLVPENIQILCARHNLAKSDRIE